ncbi:MAG: 4-(cytidine 5'-diphospho)-2-C-methyl-D-erythritol kinase [Gammaproteobacteria bacterium]|uniref:4-diphosphocytidyl-2-C-methyl-D-erythritol kinase n=1 Tax=Candidatus Thiopontia autotrophica TaxID=2841688 RepID=A0A8J6TQL7_9GAMM|nr:4-(cytidine 5'-diphospho)-2-C-methyl-D-erythritol kinase [Candidatus Thiopontia autotrophica]MBL6968618.1 4-(cytidine 5'-diphospho)-2-C-methyl-D-erythritol kinase [Gammaproteobacteria bacterium]
METQQQTVWPAPAKLNLFLHVTGRRSDGYHELQTVFQFVDLQDQISIEVTDSGEIERPTGLEGVSAEDDLVVQAAKALQKQTDTSFGAIINVDKQIPAGGGLGGGSSDAATILVALNKLWSTGLSQAELSAIGLQLGADVPIFIYGKSAWAEGVGEELVTVEPPEYTYLLLDPGVSVSTADIFQAKELTRNTPKAKIAGFLRGSLANSGRNDCEPVVIARYPEIAEALKWLSQFGDARMTGTGGCLFVALSDHAEAERIRGQLPEKWSGFVVRGMNRSPLVTG